MGIQQQGKKSLIQVLKGREGWLGVLEPPSSLEEGGDEERGSVQSKC